LRNLGIEELDRCRVSLVTRTQEIFYSSRKAEWWKKMNIEVSEDSDIEFQMAAKRLKRLKNKKRVQGHKREISNHAKA